jgi:hypothetical protein
MNDSQPLTDIWNIYTQSLDEAVGEGFIDDEELAESYVWPGDLHFANWEQEDVKRYVHERMTEIVGKIKHGGGLDPNLIASYLFRSVLCGLMWEKERHGNYCDE